MKLVDKLRSISGTTGVTCSCSFVVMYSYTRARVQNNVYTSHVIRVFSHVFVVQVIETHEITRV